MNITELARILKITPQELRNALPLLGFHIGRKAIKINKSEANKIIKDWPNLRRKIEKQKEEKQKEEEEKKKQFITTEKVEIPEFIPVRDFSTLTGAPVSLVLAELMKNGIFASLNEKIKAQLIDGTNGNLLNPINKSISNNACLCAIVGSFFNNP